MRLAHASLQHKLNSRSPSKQKVSANISENESDNKLDAEEKITETDSEIKPVGIDRGCKVLAIIVQLTDIFFG